jgi:hypothetical protein
MAWWRDFSTCRALPEVDDGRDHPGEGVGGSENCLGGDAWPGFHLHAGHPAPSQAISSLESTPAPVPTTTVGAATPQLSVAVIDEASGAALNPHGSSYCRHHPPVAAGTSDTLKYRSGKPRLEPLRGSLGYPVEFTLEHKRPGQASYLGYLHTHGGTNHPSRRVGGTDPG